VIENIIQSNRSNVGGGIYGDNSEIVSNSVVHNSANHAEGGALHYFGSGTVRDNCLVSNTADGERACGGIYVSGNPTITANNIYGNSGYALYIANVVDAPEVSARRNFWGVLSERAVLNLTYDWLDNEEVGLANISPHLEKMSSTAPPPPPSSVLSSMVAGGIRLSWDKPEGLALEGYTVHYGTKSGYPYEKTINTGPEKSLTIPGLKTGSEYWFAVSGYRIVEGTRFETALSEEVHVRFAGVRSSVAPPNILPAGDTKKDKIRYQVLNASPPTADSQVDASRWQVSSFKDNFSALTLEKTISSGDVSQLNIARNALPPGEEHFYRVAYRTSAGNWSGWSTPASFVTDRDDRSILSGPVAKETRLEKRFSPYEMVGNTLITPKGRLVVEAGVRINIAPGKNLMVQGELVAQGTASDPIVFARESSEKWGQLIFADACKDAVMDDAGVYAGGCVLERCIVEHGKGILIKSASPLIKDCTISYHDGSGIALRQGGPVITGNDIHHNTAPTNGGGIYAYTNDVAYVKANKIHDNHANGDGGGVFAYGYMNTSAIRVEGNTISSNRATGDGGGIYLSRSSAVNNSIKSNAVDGNGGGIYATFGLVSANELHNNRAYKGGGVFAEQNSSITRNHIASNRAESGLGGGVYINFWGTSIENESFMENTVTKNSAPAKEGNGGVFILGYLFFERNNIYGNNGSQLYNGNESESYSLRVTGCYWGTDNKNAISKMIVDGNDRPELGEVTFEPFSREPFQFD
jgi:hypothetical protein